MYLNNWKVKCVSVVNRFEFSLDGAVTCPCAFCNKKTTFFYCFEIQPYVDRRYTLALLKKRILELLNIRRSCPTCGVVSVLPEEMSLKVKDEVNRLSLADVGLA